MSFCVNIRPVSLILMLFPCMLEDSSNSVETVFWVLATLATLCLAKSIQLHFLSEWMDIWRDNHHSSWYILCFVFDVVDLLVVFLPCCSSALLLFLSVALLPLFYGLFLRSVIIPLLLSSNVRTSSSQFITKRMIWLKRQVLIVISVCVAFPFL